MAENEFDSLLTPSPDKVKTLDYWRDHSHDFPHLSLMARDTFAVPATGAGVERMFSTSGRMATWTRARNHVVERTSGPTWTSIERSRGETEGKKDKKKKKVTGQRMYITV